MHEKISLTPYWLLAATFVGIADTLYLSYYHWLGITPGCAIGGCEIVLNSPYSSPLGVPFAYLGLLYYLHMLGLAILVAYLPNSRGLALAALFYSGIGLLLSIGFELFQFFIIGALCMYCAISAVTTLVLFSVAVWYWKQSRK